MFDRADISYTHYVRTTDTQHMKKVEAFWVRRDFNDHSRVSNKLNMLPKYDPLGYIRPIFRT